MRRSRAVKQTFVNLKKYDVSIDEIINLYQKTYLISLTKLNYV